MQKSPAVSLRSYNKTSNRSRCPFDSWRKSLAHPHRAILPGVPTSSYVDGVEKVSSRNSLKPMRSILQKLFHRRRDVAGLRQDYILELRLVRAEGVHGGNAPDRGVQLLEEFVGDARRDFSAIAPA